MGDLVMNAVHLMFVPIVCAISDQIFAELSTHSKKPELVSPIVRRDEQIIEEMQKKGAFRSPYLLGTKRSNPSMSDKKCGAKKTKTKGTLSEIIPLTFQTVKSWQLHLVLTKLLLRKKKCIKI